MGFFDSLVEGLGKGVDSLVSHRQAKENMKQQTRFAREGIQWRVEDAKRAGIHPLFALGASTQSFSPISVGSDFGGMGQSLGRAVAASANSDERSMQRQGMQLELENKRLQNDILKAKLASDRTVAATGSGPPKPKLTNLTIGGADIRANPAFSDAQEVENRHGDLAGSLYGMASIPADAYFNYRRPTGPQIENWVKRAGRYLWDQTFGTRPAY